MNKKMIPFGPLLSVKIETDEHTTIKFLRIVADAAEINELLGIDTAEAIEQMRAARMRFDSFRVVATTGPIAQAARLSFLPKCFIERAQAAEVERLKADRMREFEKEYHGDFSQHERQGENQMSAWVYQRSEPGLYTVGFYDPGGRWHGDSDHESREKAANRVAFLNGRGPGHFLNLHIDEVKKLFRHMTIEEKRRVVGLPEKRKLPAITWAWDAFVKVFVGLFEFFRGALVSMLTVANWSYPKAPAERTIRAQDAAEAVAMSLGIDPDAAAIEIDRAIAESHECPNCKTKLVYRGEREGRSYRAFAECLNCDYSEEF